jgi:hypothetical protein
VDEERQRETAVATGGGRAEVAAAAANVSPLRLALRRARVDEAERSDVIAELRGAELARLEILLEALGPTLADLPADVDLFDVAIMPGPHPRLFIDMIGFVEMGRDRRAYRFLQDTRHGRTTLAESERVEAMVGAVTDYMARRLVEREKALAADATPKRVTPVSASKPSRPAAPGRRSIWRAALAFVIDCLGSAVLVAVLGLAAWQGYHALMVWLGKA